MFSSPHNITTNLCKITGGLGCLCRLTCRVCVVGLYRHEASLLPLPLRCTPIMACPSGCLTRRGWEDITLTGAGGMAGAETEQSFSQIIKQYIRFQNKMLQHGIKSHKAIIPQIVKFFFTIMQNLFLIFWIYLSFTFSYKYAPVFVKKVETKHLQIFILYSFKTHKLHCIQLQALLDIHVHEVPILLSNH